MHEKVLPTTLFNSDTDKGDLSEKGLCVIA